MYSRVFHAPKWRTFQAHTQIYSWALRDTFLCPLSFQEVPIHSCHNKTHTSPWTKRFSRILPIKLLWFTVGGSHDEIVSKTNLFCLIIYLFFWLLHVRQVLLSVAVPGPQLEEGWHGWRWGYRWERWVPEATVVRVALGEGPVGVCPGCRVGHGGGGQAVVICITKTRDINDWIKEDRQDIRRRRNRKDFFPESSPLFMTAYVALYVSE